jgi:hypothetical protein
MRRNQIMEKEITYEQIESGIIHTCDDYQSHLEKYLSGDKEEMREIAGIGSRLNSYFEDLTKNMKDSPEPRIERRMFVHEVGNLLQTLHTIPNFLTEMEGEEDLEKEYKENAKINLKQIRDLSGLISTNIKDYQKIIESSSRFDAKEAIKEAIEYTTPFLKNMNIQFKENYQEGQIDLYSNRSIILAAISTILGNSLKYIKLEKDKTNEIDIDLEQDKKSIILRVTNPYCQSKTTPNVSLGQNLGIGTAYLDQISLAFEGSSVTRRTEKGEKFICELKIPRKYLEEKVIKRYQKMKKHPSKKSLETIASQ